LDTGETRKTNRKPLVLGVVIVVVVVLLLVAFASGLFSAPVNNAPGGNTSNGEFSLASYAFGNNGHTMLSVTLEDKGTAAATVVGIVFDGRSLSQGTQCANSWDSEVGGYQLTPQADLTLFICPSNGTQIQSGQHSIEFMFETGSPYTATISV
jgi:hypothetical protein